MKFLLATLVTLCFALGLNAAALPATCTTQIPRDSCAFYDDCLEATYPCGGSGYAIGYGGKFCRAFSGNATRFSAKGQKWISDVMLCLQTELVPLISKAPAAKPTCPAIKTFAFNSHPKCYVSAGVCALPPTDFIALLQVIGLKQLLADFEAIKQSVTVSAECLVKWTQALFHVGHLRG
jgi:hypothetical protein